MTIVSVHVRYFGLLSFFSFFIFFKEGGGVIGGRGGNGMVRDKYT